MANFPPVIPTSQIGRAYEIINEIRGGITTDDDDISVRQIMRAIDTEYASVLQEDLDRRQREGLEINRQLYQTYSCLELEDDNKNCGCGASICGIKKVAIPKFIQYGGKPAIGFFGTDQGLQFSYAVNISDARTKAAPQVYGSTRPSYYIEGDYAYVVLPPKIKSLCSVTISGIPEVPSSTTGENCFDIWSSEYPIAGYLWSEVKRRVMGKDGNALITSSQVRDNLNNANSGNVTPTK